MIDILKPLIKQFLPFAQKKMGFDRPPRLFLKQDAENAANPLGKTGFYDPQAESITLFVTDRHPKDVMRSLSHELMHHTQKCNGEFENVENMGEQGYAQNNSHMRTMEIQAYQASIVFRDWEDSIKGTIYNESLQKGVNEIMSTKNWKDKELNTLLLEKWGFKFNPDGLTEDTGGPAGELTPKEAKEEEKKGDRPYVSKEEEEGNLEEGEGSKKGEYARRDKKGKVGQRAGVEGGGKYGKGGHYKDYEGHTKSKKGKATSASLDWGGNEGDYLRKKEDGTRKKTGDVGGGKYGKGGHYKAYEKNEGRLHEDNEEEDQDLYEKHDPDWGMGKDEKSRTHPGEEDYTGHEGDESKTHPGELDYEPEEGDVKDHAHRAMQAIHDLAGAAGVELETEVTGPDDEDVEEEEIEEIEERRGRGRADPRQRPVAEEQLRKAIMSKKVKITEEQMRQIILRARELRQERKNNKG